MRRRHLLPLILGGLTACHGRGSTEDFVLRVGVVAPIGEVSPVAASGGAANAGDLLFEALARPQPGGYTSRFLRRWERLGPRRWRLDLEPGPRFSDGSPVTVSDVAGVLRTAKLSVISESESSLVVETRAATPIEPDLVFINLARKTPGGWLGTGPFVLESQTPERVVLRRFHAGAGRIARVELVACASPREIFARLLRGELNAMIALDPAMAELLEGVPGVRLLRGSSPGAMAALLAPRLTPDERRRLVAALPTAEVSAAAHGERCCAEPHPPLPPVPSGRPLRIGYWRYTADFWRSAVALRRALGERGGELVPIANVEEMVARVPSLDVLLTPMLVRPPGVGARYFGTSGSFNHFGYSDAAYDAALAAGDEQAAEDALRRNPPAVVLYRRERIAAVDARLRDATLSEWGILETLPDWMVSP